MEYVLNQRYDGTGSIVFLGSETLDSTNRTVVLETEGDIKGITKVKDYNYEANPSDDYLTIKFKFKIDSDYWSELYPIESLKTLEINENYSLELQIYIYYSDQGNENAPSITLTNFTVDFDFNYQKTDSVAKLTEPNQEIILEPKDIYKIFSLEDFLIYSKGIVDDDDYIIKYRFTQDMGYTFTDWAYLNKENLSTTQLNELRFAKVQYLIKKTENNPDTIFIYDIVLIGDFQNVSANYQKVNRYGLKEDCISKLMNKDGSINIEKELNDNYYTQGLSCYKPQSTLDELKNQDKSKYWSPYKHTEISEFYNMLASNTNDIFGWDVDYFKTDPDGNGRDMTLHEYQLYNVVKQDEIKIIVPENQFPDNTIKINQFNLDLFDTFEVHLLKDEFKNSFGLEERPAENDILHFCITNRIYYIKHAQIYKDIMYSGIYYKLILEKYSEKPNIQHKKQETKDAIDDLTKNNTIDSLFGFEKEQDAKKVANKDQTYPTTFDKIRFSLSKSVKINNDPIYNGEVPFIENYYDLSKLINRKAVEYKKADNKLEKSGNRSFISWFRLKTVFDEQQALTKRVFEQYPVNPRKKIILLDNYDQENDLGYQYFIYDNSVAFKINNNYYELETPNLLKNVWYGVVINLNQRLKELDMYLYKRDSSIEITYFHPETYERRNISYDNENEKQQAINDGLKPVVNTEHGQTAVSEFELLYHKKYEGVEIEEFEHDVSLKLIGENMDYSNLRVFDKELEEESINNILNQNVVKDAQYLILADNANRKIYSKNIPKNHFS